VALLRSAQIVAKLVEAETEDDAKAGLRIVVRALAEPLKRIAENAGYEGSIVAEHVLANDTFGWGFNALTEEYEDLLKAGVIDPAKVVRCSLENASSIAALVLTTETLVAEIPKKAEPMGGGGPGGGMGDYDM
jgi:chaperonin GroEL